MDIPSKVSLRSGLLGLGAAAISTAYKLSRRAADAVKSDPLFPTSTTMVKRPAPRGRTALRYRKRAYVMPKRMPSLRYRFLYRSTGVGAQFTLTTGIGYINSPALSFIPTADLIASYRLYRIKKVVWTVYPRVDPANSGIINNHVFTMYAACNAEGPVATPAASSDITIYDKHTVRTVTSGSMFKYTFYPKVTNTVQGASSAVASGSYKTNPWLKLDSTGITVPHQQLLAWTQNGGTAGTTVFDGYFTFYFDVMG